MADDEHTIMTRPQAKALGLKRYWTGKPCPAGHIAYRLVSNWTCVECAQIRLDAWADKVEYTPVTCKYGHVSTRTTNGGCLECGRLKIAAIRAANPEVEKERTRKWRADNPEKAKAATDNWRAANADRVTATTIAWREANAESYQEQQRTAAKTRYDEDINHKLGLTLRNRVNRCLKKNRKPGSAVRDLGCTLGELRAHIAEQFTDGMAWDNWGALWQVDHVRPLGSYDLTQRDQFLAACHYTNLRPLLLSDHKLKTVEDRKAIRAAKRLALST